MTTTLLGAALGFGASTLRGDAAQRVVREPTRYAATTTLSVLGASLTTSSGTQRPVNLDQLALFATKGAFPNAIADQLGVEPSEVLERITTRTDQATGTLALTAVGDDPGDVVDLADVTATQLVESVNAASEQEFAQQVAAANRRVTDLRTRLDAMQSSQPPATASLGEQESWRAQLTTVSAQLGRAYSTLTDLVDGGNTTLPLRRLDEATAITIAGPTYHALVARARSGEHNTRVGSPESEPVAVSDGGGGSVSAPAMTIAGGILGLLLGGAGALFLEQFSRRLRSREEVEAAYALPVLAEVPKVRKGPGLAPSRSIVGDAHRALRSMLLFALDAGPPQNGAAAPTRRNGALVILVVSANQGEGKTTTVVNLGAAFAEGGARVLLLDCDARHPSLHRLLGHGESSCIPAFVADSGMLVASAALAGADTSPAQVVADQRTAIDEARGAHFDVIIVDTAPLLATSDAYDLLTTADAVLVVSRFGSTRTRDAQLTGDLLRQVGATPLGVVLVGSGESVRGYYYGGDEPAGAQSIPKRLGLPAQPDPASASIRWRG